MRLRFEILQEMQKLKTIEEVEDSMLKHGEMIIDILGSEVDRLEQKIVVSRSQALNIL